MRARHRPGARVLLAVATVVLCASPLRSQGTPATPSTGGLEVWGGYAASSPQWGALGEAPGMNLGLLGLRWTRALGAPPARGSLPRFEYGIDLIPVARLSPPLVSLRGSGVPCATAALCVVAPDVAVAHATFPTGSPYGVGLNPIVLTRRFANRSRLSFSVGASAGLLWFERRVPTTQASRLNATAGVEAGLRLGPPDASGITLTYRFHHLSNGGRAGENPGLASHLIAIGLHRARVSGERDRGASHGRP